MATTPGLSALAPTNDEEMAAATRAALANIAGPYQAQTPEQQAYAAELAKYVGGLDAQYGKYGGTQLYGDRYAQLPFGGPQLYKAPTASQISSYYGKTPEQNAFYTFNLPSNKGNPTGQVNVTYNTPIALYDYDTGKVVYSGTGFDAAEKVAEMARGLSESQGRKAQWGIYTGAPGSTDPATFKQVAYEKPNASVVGQVADVALPTIGAILGGPLGAAAGSAVSSVAQGRGVGDTLLRAALSGGLSYAGGQIGGGAAAGGASGGAGGAASGVTTGLTQGALQGGVQEIGNEIIITAAKKAVEQGLASSITQAISSGVASALADTMAGNAMQGYEPGAVKNVPTPASVSGIEQTVTAGWRPTVSGVTSGATGSAAGAGLGGASLPKPTTQQPFDANDLDPEIPVTATPRPSGDPFSAAIAAGMGPLTLPTQQQLDSMTPEQKSTWDKIQQYIKYGYLGLNAVGALSEALGGNKPGTGTAGTGAINPIFSAKLPEPSAGFGSSDFAARPVSTYGGTGVGGGMTMEDWLTYGTRPERSFFSYVPENKATIAAPVTPPTGGGGTGTGGGTGGEDTGGGRGDNNNPRGPRGVRGPRVREREVEEVKAPKVRKAMGGYAAGGPRKTFAVEGPGTGRSDDIPAVLSDGEYVIDAETVALLGDGSSKAGAKKLDQFRVNVRKHKGRKLAKGRFSANAKAPEKYLAGGKA